MTHKERFFATVKREKVDRPAAWLGMPHKDALPGLLSQFGIKAEEELTYAVNDDIRAIHLPYGQFKSVYSGLNFAPPRKENSHYHDTLTEDGIFHDIEDMEEVLRFPWPDPEKFIDREQVAAFVDSLPKDKILMAIMWEAHFQDACSAFGMEEALARMVIDPELFSEVIDRITDFYYRANEIYFDVIRGKVDAVLIGNDMGTQNSMIASPQSLRELVFPGTRKLIGQIKEHGMISVHHSCGAIDSIIPDLIEIGVDVIHPIQAKATDMQAERLKEKYGGKVSFCGGVDTQDLLVNASEKEIQDDVRRLIDLFPTGLIVSPSHEAILPDIPPQNIQALFSFTK